MTGAFRDRSHHRLPDDLPAAADTWERAGAVDRAGVRAVAAHGLLGLTVPAGYGGGGLSLRESVEAHREVAGHSPSLQSLLVVHGMVCHAVRRWGRPELREDLLPRLARGELLGAFALTEQEAGSDLRALRTRLREQDGQLLVTGRKRWVSFGQLAHVLLVFGVGAGGGTSVLVPVGAGARVRPEQVTTGLRASRLADVTFHETPVPPSAVVGRPGFGVPHVATDCLTVGRLFVAAAAVGVAEAAIGLAAAHAAARMVGGEPLGCRQLVRALLAEASVAAEAAWHSVCSAADTLDRADPAAALAASRAKFGAAQAASLATAHASRVLGAGGLTEEHRLTRLDQAARTYQVIEGPTEVLKDLIGAAVVNQARGAVPHADGVVCAQEGDDRARTA